jgi:hypothetical protein
MRHSGDIIIRTWTKVGPHEDTDPLLLQQLGLALLKFGVIVCRLVDNLQSEASV